VRHAPNGAKSGQPGDWTFPPMSMLMRMNKAAPAAIITGITGNLFRCDIRKLPSFVS